ncbi:DUF4038 domain-containing protein [candidate division KSB1 bacterium]|nr:DUF4038 domain-containing protein [candidate division KSB1 bacterium]
MRFAPVVEGEWSNNTSSNDIKLDGLSGVFECITSSHKDFVRTNGYYFYYDNGEPFFRMGDTSWRLYRSKNAPFATHFKPYIDARAEQGFNFICSVDHTVGDPSINEGGSLWLNDSDLDRLQSGYFDTVDARIDYLLDRDFVPGLFFAWAQTFDDFLQPQFERFARYLADYSSWRIQA